MGLANIAAITGLGLVALACNCKDVGGRMYDDKNDCMMKREIAGCTELQDCDDAVTSARDEDGNIWVFGNTCIPKGWDAVEFDDHGIGDCD